MKCDDEAYAWLQPLYLYLEQVTRQKHFRDCARSHTWRGGGEEARNQFKFAGPAGVLNGLRFRAVWDLALGS